MATRYAVATGGWNDAIWAATAGGAAGSAAVPTTSDDATINLGQTVTVDDTSAVALTVTVNGTLQPSQTADSTLTIEQGLSTAATTTSHILYDMSSVPTLTAKILLSANGTMTTGVGYALTISGDFLFKGASKKNASYTTAAMTGGTTISVEIEDVTGWRVGDKIVFATTQAYVYSNYGGTHTCAWSGGYLTMTRSSGNNDAAIVVGLPIRLDQFSNNINGSYIIYDVPTANTFRIAMPDPGTITDSTGVLRSQPSTDQVTIDSITPTTGTAATVAWSDGSGASGSVFFNHADKCLVGNFTRNVIIGPKNRHEAMFITPSPANRTTTAEFRDVMFASGRLGTGYPYSLIRAGDYRGWLGINYCTFYDWTGQTSPQCLIWPTNSTSAPMIRLGNMFYNDSNESTGVSCVQGGNCPSELGDDVDTIIFRSRAGIVLNWPQARAINPRISGVVSQGAGAIDALTSNGATPVVVGGAVWGGQYTSVPSQGANSANYILSSVRLGIGDGYGVYDAKQISELGNSGNHGVTYDGCLEHSGGFTISSINVASNKVRLFNRNGDATVQQVFLSSSLTTPAIIREATTINRSASSLQFEWTATTDLVRDESTNFLTKDGVPVTITGYFRKNSTYGSSTLPYVEVSGLGITPVRITATSASTDAWEKFEFLPSTATEVVQNTGGDAYLTLTFVGQSAVNGAKCWFSGVPLAPFVTRCRHYGYLFDETSLTRTTDITKSASEATAAAYSGVNMNFSWSATAGSSTTTVIADTTFQELYDGHQAQAVLNVDKAIALHGAGVADSPSLFADGNVTLDTTKKLSGGGTIDMGSKLLTSDSPFSFTYTGGVFSQATTVPNFSGGTLNIGAAGSYSFTQLAAMILSMTPTAPGTYLTGDNSYTGQIDLRNTTAHAITVELPSGTSYTTANNTGGAITVSLPVVTSDISITSMPDAVGASDRLQIINTTALSASAWVANTVYATGAIVKRTTGIGSESTAGLYFRATTGGTSHATTEPTWDTTVGNTTADNTVVWTTYSILFYDADPAGTSYATTYIEGEEFLTGETVTIRFAEMDGATSFKDYDTTVIVTSSGFSALVAETADDVYATFAIDGSAYDTTYSPNYVSDYIVLDTNTDFSGASAFAYFCYIMTTSQGMYEFWGGMTGVDAGNIRIESDILDLYFDSSAGFVKQTDNVRIYRKDGVRPALDPTSDGYGVEINWRTPVSVITTSDQAVNEATVIAGLTAQGYTATRGANLDKALTTGKFIALK